MMRKLVLTAIVCAVGATAQNVESYMKQRSGAGGPTDVLTWTAEVPPPGGAGMRVMSAAPQPVKGAPYAADSVTERIQVLADGNRIVEKSSSKQFRDSEGRTRSENEIGGTLAFVPAQGKMSLIFINDPVAGVHYTLHPQDKRAEKFALPKTTMEAGHAGRVEVRKEVVVTSGHEAHEGPMHGPAVMVFHSQEGSEARMSAANRTKTPLGKRLIEGVEAEGTKIVETIPAGAMGNEKPIETVSEVWYSAELKADVLRRSSDPRFGETTYKLANLIRGEQPRSLFEPPADYKVSEPQMKMRVEKKQ